VSGGQSLLLVAVLSGLASAAAWAAKRPAADEEASGAPNASAAPVLLALAALAIFVAFAHEVGWYVGDNRFVHNWAPHRALDALRWSWNPRLDLGGPEQHYHPLTDGLLAGFRTLGLEPWATQRAWFAFVLGTGATGTALVVRAMIPGARLEAMVGGLWFICSPYATGFFFPTSLLLNVALVPWFVLAVWYGTRTPSQWRWAAVFAAGVALSGSRNPPGLLMAMIPAAITGVALVVGVQVSWRTLVAWSAKTGVLAVAVAAPVAVRSALSSEVLARNLASTESVDAVSLSSSWSESFRGLGFWLLYWNPRGQLVWPFVEIYFTNPWVVVATFVPPIAALGAVLLVRRPVRLLFGTIAAVSIALMVGAYPVDAPSPLGALLRRTYDSVPALFSFRNLYKAGGGLVLAVAVLLALALHELRQRPHSQRRPAHALALGVLSLAVFTASGWPLLVGEHLRHGQRLEGSVPGYWDAALDWLDRQPESGRVLIIPGTASEDYRWGSAAGGDIFPSLLDRPAIFAQPLTGTPPEASNLTIAIDHAVTGGRYESGTLAPIARRLGVRYVVVRNDLDWQRIGVDRPSTFDALRADTDMIRAASFGTPGQNVVRDDEVSEFAEAERTLPPVEIFEIAGVGDSIRGVGPASSILLSGDGAAWTSLARRGHLDNLGTVRPTGGLSSAELRDELAAGGVLVVTDSNRRRPLAWGLEERTLPVAATDRVDDLYEVPGSQSTVTFGDASSANSVGPPSLFDPGVQHRSAAAFDGDPTTAWLTGINTVPRGHRLSVDFPEPQRIDEVRVKVADVEGGRLVRKVAVILPDREPELFAVRAGSWNVLEFPAAITDSISIAPWEVDDGSGPFGFSEVSIAELDVAERVSMPDDVARRADADSVIADLLISSPLAIEMQRLTGRPLDPEGTLVRRFRSPAGRQVRVEGVIQIGHGTSGFGVATLLGAPLALDGPRSGSASAGDWYASLDGDTTTGWQVPTGESTPLTVHSAQTGVRTASLLLENSATSRLPSQVTVRRLGQVSSIRLAGRCNRPPRRDARRVVASAQPSGTHCLVTFEWPSRADDATEIRFSFLGPVSGSRTPGATHYRRITVNEIRLDGFALGFAGVDDRCRDDLLTLDGEPLPVRLDGDTSTLLSGDPLPFTSCGDVRLDRGWRELTTAAGLPVQWIRMEAVDGTPVATAAPIDIVVVRRGPVDHELTVDGPPGTRIILGQAHSPRWSARSTAGSLSEVQSLDTQAGWTLGVGGPQTLRIGFDGQATYQAALVMSVSVMSIIPLLIVADPRRGRPVDAIRSTLGIRRRSWLVPTAVGLFFAYLVGGPALLIVALATRLAIGCAWVSRTALAAGVVTLAIAAALATVPPFGPPLEPVWPLWPGLRGVAHEFARVAVIIAVILMADAVARRSDPPQTSGEPPRVDGVEG
jgi:arabinofuranan 3-O-arabinosyltransferase